MERAELDVPLTPERVQRICDYHFGVGSDGILEVVSANGAQAEVVIWNPDGSTAELSGNGTRIAARWLARRSGEDAVRVRVGPREVIAVDAAGYFSRPGPRLVDGLEVLAHALHPDRVPPGPSEALPVPLAEGDRPDGR